LFGFKGCTIPYMAPEMAQGMLPFLHDQPITGNVSALPTHAFPLSHKHALLLPEWESRRVVGGAAENGAHGQAS
jgi:hypothetical protein